MIFLVYKSLLLPPQVTNKLLYLGNVVLKADVPKTHMGTGWLLLLMHTGKRAIVSNHKLLTTIAASTDENIEYVLEGSVFTAGASVQWLRDEMKMLKTVDESEYVAQEVEDTNGVYMVPACSGLGAPYWDAYARGTLLGLTRGSNCAHIVRAVLEAIAFQTYDVHTRHGSRFWKKHCTIKSRWWCFCKQFYYAVSSGFIEYICTASAGN